MTSALRQSGKERKMGKALIIGAGGVAGVVVHKCCQNSEVFTEICIASRTKSKCDALKKQVEEKGTKTKVTTAQVDADNVPELVALINKEKPDIVINVALPYQDLTIMDACLETKTDYVDTANYEHPDTAKFEYKYQWAYREKFEKAGITALLGSGFDPGGLDCSGKIHENKVVIPACRNRISRLPCLLCFLDFLYFKAFYERLNSCS